jgi:lipopolysaccharide/colanic/teichoic acid biosynthesis glycosyltransferase
MVVLNRLMDRQESALSWQPKSQRAELPVWKRALDLTFVLLISPAWVVLGGMVAVVVRFGSPGPIFFRQVRIGQKGHPFTCYKFRTMKVDAETDSHRRHTQTLIKTAAPMIKLDACNDPRLIPLGSALRATGLDELPQVLNIFRGDMSLVGPRPCLLYEYEAYEPRHRHRLDAAPGLTGLWQVSGKNRTTFEEMVRLDIEYSKRLSLLLDLKIILKTLPALWTQCGDLRAAKRQDVARRPRTVGKTVETYRL